MSLPRNETPCLEKRLLVCCARTRMQPLIAEQIREIVARPLDWDFLLTAAAENSVMPLLGRHLPTLAANLVAPEQIERLKGACRASAVRCLSLAGELIKILGQFESEGILAIPWKGPVLAAQAYGDIAMREYEDLDLIVRQSELPRAHEVMLRLGFRAKYPWIHPGGATGSLVPGEYNYVDDGRRLIVELHTEFTLRHFPVTPDLGDYSRRLVTVSLSGHPVQTLSIEDALPVLCVHGAKDFWERISWVADISELVQRAPALDWDAVWQRAERMKAERMLSLGLALAAGLLEAPLPSEVRLRVQSDEVATRIAAELQGMLLRRDPVLPSGTVRAKFRMKMVAGTFAGLRYSMRLAIAPAEEDWQMMRLPRVLAPLYIALRPLRLLKKYRRSGRGSERLPS
jgi:hypothetical protein